MIGLMELWLPILVSAVFVFVVSSLIHMVIPWHKNDYPRLPQEDAFRAAVGPMDLPPGDYMIPRASSSADMKSAEFVTKMEQGPNVVMTVMPKGTMGMGQSLVLWFLYAVLVSVFAAYIAGRVLPAGAEYLEIFRFAGTTAFLGYSMALLQMSIWYRRGWGLTLKSMLDGLLYAAVTAGAFGWLWPA